MNNYKYYLMNKDEVFAEIKLNKMLDEDYSIEVVNKYVNNMFTDDIEKVIYNRKPPKHREHIEKLLKMCGIKNLKGLIDYTHLLSLNDTLWVKSVNSDLQWRDVSLYTNEFDEVVAKIAFDGDMCSTTLSTLTPEFGTSGSFAKCWVREDGNNIYMKKKGSSGFANTGLEPFSEYYTQQIMQTQIQSILNTLYTRKIKSFIQNANYSQVKMLGLYLQVFS